MNIGLYGDSTQLGISNNGGVTTQNEYPPSKVVQMMLDEKYGPYRHFVSSYGVGGSTIISAMDTPLYSGKNFTQHMQCHWDDIIVANWGINDSYVAGNTPAAHKSYYTALKSTIEGCGKKFLYESPNPMNNTHDPIMASLDTAVKQISGISVADVSWQTRAYYPQWAVHLSDGVHPNQIMYFWIGLVLFKGVDSLIQACQ